MTGSHRSCRTGPGRSPDCDAKPDPELPRVAATKVSTLKQPLRAWRVGITARIREVIDH